MGLPEVRAKVKAGGKRSVGGDCGAHAGGRHRDSVCFAVPDGHLQPVFKAQRVLQVGHHAEVQLAPWRNLPLTGFNTPERLFTHLRKQSSEANRSRVKGFSTRCSHTGSKLARGTICLILKPFERERMLNLLKATGTLIMRSKNSLQLLNQHHPLFAD